MQYIHCMVWSLLYVYREILNLTLVPRVANKNIWESLQGDE